jgi:hypothetical protein
MLAIHLDNAEQCTGLCASVIPQQWVAELKRGRSNSTKWDRHTTNTRPGSEVINQDRHRLLNTAAVGIAAAVAAGRLKAIMRSGCPKL